MPPLGSSPRVRGRQTAEHDACFASGLIPACAGQTGPVVVSGTRGRAHPRVCGADSLSPRSATWTTGSSPRVRGRLAGLRAQIRDLGLIPACAGQTDDLLIFASVDVGSSPRVRGRQSANVVAAVLGGLIPACAGQTCLSSTARSRVGAHPRVCGADLRRNPRRPLRRGSSPRVRGRRMTTSRS